MEESKGNAAINFFGMWAVAFVVFTLFGFFIYGAVSFVTWDIHWPGDSTDKVVRGIFAICAVFSMIAAAKDG